MQITAFGALSAGKLTPAKVKTTHFHSRLHCVHGVTLNKSSAVVEMGDRLATIDMGRKVGGGLLSPFPWGDWVPI